MTQLSTCMIVESGQDENGKFFFVVQNFTHKPEKMKMRYDMRVPGDVGRFATLAMALRLFCIADTEDTHNIPFRIEHVGNRVKRVLPVVIAEGSNALQ